MVDLPLGAPLPEDGSLSHPDVSSGFGAYVHIPFCQVRCGYCDFNTYTNTDFGEGASTGDFHESLYREIDLSRRVLDVGDADANGSEADPGALTTVFFGGGTPTMLQSAQLVAVLGKLRDTFGIAHGAEVSTEVNPETVTYESLKELRDGGFTRMSFGMQSAIPHVLAKLDRQHTPGQVDKVVEWARALGLEFSVDLIYGAPGESIDDWRASVEAAIALDPGHISAYGLTIEPGTKMGAQLKRGEIPEPDPDELAEKYTIADELLSAAGYEWYEVSNWSKPGKHSRHNKAYWTNTNWWGYGPGAHSHINGTRFWNVKHPLAYAQKLVAGHTPSAGHESLSADEQREELIMLGIRLHEGIPTPENVSSDVVASLISDGLVEPGPALHKHLVLTLKGRLLADTVIRALW